MSPRNASREPGGQTKPAYASPPALGVARRGRRRPASNHAAAIGVDDVRQRSPPCARGGTSPSSSRAGRRPCPCGRRHEARHELGMADEVGLRARDLRQPEEADRAPRRRQRPLPDRRGERARDLEDRGAAGGVVVGAGGLVAEVRGQDDLARRRVRSRDRRDDDVVGRRDHLRVRRARAEHDLLAGGEPRAAAPRPGASRP